MSSITRTSRIVTVAALAASTALSGPIAAYAQEQAVARLRLAQAEVPPVVVPEGGAPAQDAAPEPEAPAAEEPPPEAPAAEEPAPEPEAPAAEEPAPEPEAPAEEPQAEEPAPEPEAPAEEPQAEEPAEPAPAVEEARPEEPAAEEPAAEQPAAPADATQAPAADAPAADAPAATPDAAPSGPAATPEAAPATGDAQPAAPGAEAPPAVPAPGAETGTGRAGQSAPEVAPQGAPAADGTAPATLAAPPPPTTPPQPVAAEIQESEVAPGGVAASDARVQNIEQTITINSVTNVEGTRIEQAPVYQLPPQVQQVERTDDDRQILTIIGAGIAGAAAGAAASYFIRSNDESRLRENSQDFYVEELPRGQTRETIVRDNGVQVVTIYDRYGEVVQRSRILPDRREVVLFYDPYEDDDQGQAYYYDVGAQLPPIDLTIPEDAYIVDVDRPDEDLYYRTIVAPPVETVERIYSVDEVRRSKRIRDKVRRIDLATINFDFGSYTIPQAQVGNLQALADAISRVIEENPDETFLIEGHTDAVGRDVANLTLSDRRAEAVAQALTSFFDVPPENLVTQGYGEAYLKVNTQEPNAENRRVTVRRITALVKPVESASRN